MAAERTQGRSRSQEAHQVIYDDFCRKVSDFAGTKNLFVAYPGIKFDPPKSGPWLEIIWAQNGTEEVTMGDEDSAVLIGFFRALVNDRPGSIAPASAIARSLASTIPKGTAIGNAFITRQPEITGPVTDSGNNIVMTTVTFRYQST